MCLEPPRLQCHTGRGLGPGLPTRPTDSCDKYPHHANVGTGTHEGRDDAGVGRLLAAALLVLALVLGAQCRRPLLEGTRAGARWRGSSPLLVASVLSDDVAAGALRARPALD